MEGLSRIIGMKWWDRALEWNTGMGKLLPYFRTIQLYLCTLLVATVQYKVLEGENFGKQFMPKIGEYYFGEYPKLPTHQK